MFDLQLCQIDEIPAGRSKGFTLQPEPSGNMTEATVFAVHYHDAFYIYRNICPHLGLPLEWMPHQFLDRDAEYIQCATHGALFRIEDGQCIAGPCPGATLAPVPFQIQGKSIMINRSDLEKSP
jgi:nitrite reductase/ring-hydroxylating ferredoxin subunit